MFWFNISKTDPEKWLARLPGLESTISGGNGILNPIWPSACIATEASVAVSEITTSTRNLSVFWNNESGICKSIISTISESD